MILSPKEVATLKTMFRYFCITRETFEANICVAAEQHADEKEAHDIAERMMAFAPDDD